MASILLFHSVYGLREFDHAAAARLRSAGHAVIVPDLYDGKRADTVDDGFALYDRVGSDAVIERARAASADAPPDAVLAGFSMGAGVAAELWPDRPETAGVLLLHGVAPIPPAPRRGLPVQLHLAEPDPFEDEDFVADWIPELRATGVALETFRYPGVGHLFTAETLPDYDAEAAALLWGRVNAFLDRL